MNFNKKVNPKTGQYKSGQSPRSKGFLEYMSQNFKYFLISFNNVSAYHKRISTKVNYKIIIWKAQGVPQ